MKKLTVAFVLVLSLFAISAMAGEWTGWVEDSKCAKAEKADYAGHEGCAAKCIKGGASPVFVTGGKVLKIDDASKVADHIGHNVKITGEVSGDTLKVEHVEMVKKSS